jgi:hypothetical protein
MCNIQHLSIGVSSLIGFSISGSPSMFPLNLLIGLSLCVSHGIYLFWTGKRRKTQGGRKKRIGEEKRREKEKRRGKEKGGDSGPSQFSLAHSLSVTSMNEKKRNKKRGRHMGV